jgi:hypothetical protein
MTGVLFSAGESFALLHSVQTGSGAHTTSYPMCTEGLFPRGLSGMGVKLTNLLHLVPSSRMMELYLHSSYVFIA